MYIVSWSAFVAKYIDFRLWYFRVIGCIHVGNHACELCLVKELCHYLWHSVSRFDWKLWSIDEGLCAACIVFKTGLLCSCCSSTWLVMFQCCLVYSIIWIELMVKIVRGRTRVVFWNIVGLFIQSDRSCLYRCCVSLRMPVADRGQIYRRNETNMCITISVTMNTAYLHISRHNFLKHPHAYYSFAD